MPHTILYISPLPPPHGGIATWTNKIFEQGLPDGAKLTLVNTKIRGGRNIFDKALLSLTEMSRTLKIFTSLLYQLIVNRPQLTHLNSSLSSAGIFRDLSCAAITKLFRVPLV